MPTKIFIKSPDDIIRCQSSSSNLSSPHHSILSASRQSSHRLRRRPPASLSSKDTSASSRLSGYLFIFTAYIVLFVSSIKHEHTQSENIVRSQNYDDATDTHNLPSIEEWKRLSSIIGSAAISILMVLITLIHFDMVCAPNLWLAIFKDGSYGEAIILILLILASLFMVYVSTSVSGIGGVVGKNYNVYFSSWIGFFACSYTLGLWKTSAISNNNLSLRASLASTSTDRSNINYAWTWTLFFSLVTFFALLDIFVEDDDGEPLADNQISIMLLSSSMSVLCCLIVLLMNIVCAHFQPYCRKIWKIIEGILLVALIVFWTWAVFRFTGVNGLVNGPSNAYFGSWGSFFCSISTFGYWKVEFNRRH